MKRVVPAVAVAVAGFAAVAWGQPPGGEPPRGKTGVEKKAGGPGVAGQPPGGPGGFGQPGPGGPPPGFGPGGPFPGGPGVPPGFPGGPGVPPGFPGGPGVPPGFPGGPGVPPGFPGGPPAKADPQVEAWVKTLTDKMNDPHDAIRESARAALVAVGPPALPALRRIAEGADAKAYTATRLVQQIERGSMAGYGGLGVGGFGPAVPPPDGRRPDAPAPDGGRRPGADAAPALPRLLGELKLTDRQREQVEKVVEGYAAKMRETMEGVRAGRVEREGLRDAILKLAEESTAELKRALTPEQLRLFEQLAPAGRPLFPTPFGPGEAAPGRGERPDPNAPERPRTPRDRP